VIKIGYKSRGKRDGTGSFEESFRRKIERKTIGRRKEAGELCPEETEDSFF